jgi:hypothetical protein
MPDWSDTYVNEIGGGSAPPTDVATRASQATCVGTPATPWYNKNTDKCEACPFMYPNWDGSQCKLTCPSGTTPDANKHCKATATTTGGSGATAGTNPGATATTTGTTCTNPAFCAGLPSSAPAGTPQASPCYTECQAAAQAEQNRCADLWTRTGWALSAEGCPATITGQASSSGCGCGETTPTAAAGSCPYAAPAVTSCPYAAPAAATGCSCQR